MQWVVKRRLPKKRVSIESETNMLCQTPTVKKYSDFEAFALIVEGPWLAIPCFHLPCGFLVGVDFIINSKPYKPINRFSQPLAVLSHDYSRGLIQRVDYVAFIDITIAAIQPIIRIICLFIEHYAKKKRYWRYYRPVSSV